MVCNDAGSDCIKLSDDASNQVRRKYSSKIILILHYTVRTYSTRPGLYGTFFKCGLHVVCNSHFCVQFELLLFTNSKNELVASGYIVKVIIRIGLSTDRLILNQELELSLGHCMYDLHIKERMTPRAYVALVVVLLLHT